MEEMTRPTSSNDESRESSFMYANQSQLSQAEESSMDQERHPKGKRKRTAYVYHPIELWRVYKY